MPCLPVADVQRSLDFYTHHLGFSDPWTWGDPVGDGGCSNGVVSLMFTRQPEWAASINQGHRFELILFVADVDSVYRACVDAALTVDGAPRDQSWGMREFTLLDPDGYAWRISRGL